MLLKHPPPGSPAHPHLWVKPNIHTQNKPALVGSSSATKYSQLKRKKKQNTQEDWFFILKAFSDSIQKKRMKINTV